MGQLDVDLSKISLPLTLFLLAHVDDILLDDNTVQHINGHLADMNPVNDINDRFKRPLK